MKFKKLCGFATWREKKVARRGVETQRKKTLRLGDLA
jgi:hypothetical protein